jgi:hypothetical protein
VIRLSEAGTLSHDPLLRTNASLVLEGLEFQRIGSSNSSTGNILPSIVRGEGTRQSLRVANCRFRSEARPWYMCVDASGSQSVVVVRNCEFYCPGGNAVVAGLLATRRIMDNCIYAGGEGAQLIGYHGEKQGEEIELTRNTLVSTSAPVELILVKPSPEDATSQSPTRVLASGNVFDAPSGLYFYFSSEESFPARAQPTSPEQVAEAARRLINWQDRGNLYRVGGCSVKWGAFRNQEFPARLKSPTDWSQFWEDPDASCQEGQIRYAGGNLRARLTAQPDMLTPNDFRLRPDSAGYRAGPDGKDLGADVDLVGPGAAYERWQKTPAYQQWLKDTGQVKK